MVSTFHSSSAFKRAAFKAPADWHGVLKPCSSLAKASAKRRSRQQTTVRAAANDSPHFTERTSQVLQSLVETGVRGSLAVSVAWAARHNAFDSISWDTKDVLLGLVLSLPIVVADFSLMLPDHSPHSMLRAVLESHQKKGDTTALSSALHNVSGRLRWRLILSKAQLATQQQQRHWNLQPLPLALGLEALGQMSEDLLARGVLLVLAGHWLADRLLEAGMDDTITLIQPPDAISIPLVTYAQWVAMATIGGMLAVRYMREARSLPARQAPQLPQPPPTQAPPTSSTVPRAMAARNAADVAHAMGHEEGPQAPPMGEAAMQVEQFGLALAGLRFVAAQVTLYSAFVLTGNLTASFAGGMLIQVALMLMCRARTRMP